MGMQWVKISCLRDEPPCYPKYLVTLHHTIFIDAVYMCNFTKVLP